MEYESDEVIDSKYTQEGSAYNPDIHIRWIADGAVTLTEVAHRLKKYADYCMKLEEEGWQLSKPVNDSYGFLQVK